MLPANVVFSPENGFKDTTLTISVEARFQNYDALDDPLVVVFSKTENKITAQLPLEIIDSQTNTYSASFEIQTTTTSIENYMVNVIYSHKAGLYIQKELSIKGFSNSRPQLISVNNPASVSRPTSGTKPVIFTAKATDADGQNTLEGVYMRLISQVSGEVSASPFTMYDDGTTAGDAIANDSTFTLALQINPANQLETYNIHYYAVDKGGLISDTLKTTFSIVE